MAQGTVTRPFIKFLGTAGARFVMIRQLRSSGGIWVHSGESQVLIDPGPGSIVRCAASRPRLDPSTLDGIILTHRHLDHANDVNVMIEAMTEGGFKKKGAVLCPRDALDAEPVILAYARKFPARIEPLDPRTRYHVGSFEFETSMPHIHPVATYGLRFQLGGARVALLSDTRYFPELAGEFYAVDCLIVSVVFLEPRQGIDHLSMQEVRQLLGSLRPLPRTVILTHFGMTMLAANPEKQARSLSREFGTKVLAARDGMLVRF